MKRLRVVPSIAGLLLLMVLAFGFMSCEQLGLTTKSDVKTLQSLQILANSAAVTLDPTFNLSITEYAANVASTVTSVKVVGVLTDSKATLKINGGTYASGGSATITFPDSTLTLIIVVTSEKGNSTTYTVTLSKGAGAPGDPATPVPADNATGVPYAAGLVFDWDNATNAVKYDIYLGEGTLPTAATEAGLTDSTWTSSSALKPSTTYKWKVVAKDTAGASNATSATWSFTTGATASTNRAPNNPTTPSPTDNFVNAPLNGLQLSWSCSDPDAGDSLKYNLFIGPNGLPQTATVAGLTAPNWTVTFSLQPSTTYKWKVVAKDNQGVPNASSPTWTFTTGAGGGNFPPNAPYNPSPADNAGNQPIAGLQLSWICTDPNNDTLNYDIYFGPGSLPGTVTAANLTSPNWNTPALTNGTTYYWKVVPRDSLGAINTSTPTWTFTTVAAVQQVAAPAFNPNGGTFNNSVNVTITSATPDVFIRYTISPTTMPTSSSGTLLDNGGTVQLTASGSLNAIAFKAGMTDSAINSATFTINVAVDQVAPPNFNPLGGTYTSAKTVDITPTTAGSTVSYSMSGPTGPWTPFTTMIPVNANTTIWAFASKAGMTDSVVVSATYNINLNSNPNAPVPVNPSNGQTNITPPGLTLTWSGSDPDVGDTLTYDLYWGQSAGNMNLEASGLIPTGTICSYPMTGLDFGKTYYWRVVAWDNKGGFTQGNTWSLSTAVNNAPVAMPAQTNPSNNQQNVGVDVTLAWRFNDVDGDFITYNLYFGTDGTFTTNYQYFTDVGTSYPFTALAHNTVYYWKVVAVDEHGLSGSAMWSFRTAPPMGTASLELEGYEVEMGASNLAGYAPAIIAITELKKADGSADTIASVTSSMPTVATATYTNTQITINAGTVQGTTTLTVTSSSGVAASVTVTVNDSVIVIIAQ